MKTNKAQKYREMTNEELDKSLGELKAKLFGLKCQKVVGGGTSNFCKIKEFRRDIARIKTIINENNKKAS